MEQNIKDNIVLVLPAKGEYVSTARLIASSVASRAGFNIDEVEDIKVAVAEVCNLILSHLSGEFGQYKITFDICDQELKVSFMGQNNPLKCFKNRIEDEYGLYIMRALMDTVELCNENYSIVMTKKIGE